MSFGISESRNNNYKTEWDALRGQEYDLDFDRTLFLWNVMVESLHENIDTLRDYIIVELEEFAGKRVESFIRFVEAFAHIDSYDTWAKIGGAGVVLLNRVDRRRHRTILRRVDETLERTGRDRVSLGTFRTILRDVLGVESYRESLTEQRKQRDVLTYYRQCVVYQQGIFAMLRAGTITRDQLPRPIRQLMDLRAVA